MQNETPKPPKKKKNLGGRPTKFKADLIPKTAVLYAEGKTDREICDIIGICPSTLTNWKGRYPEFLASLKENKEKADSLVEASLFRRATGYYHVEEKIFFGFGVVTRVETVKHYPPDTSACIFWLKNRKPKEWRELSVIETKPPTPEGLQKKPFEQFCLDAGYPAPYPKQIEMMNFGINEPGAHMILGSRGYGKTDYVVILGAAYAIYLNDQFRCLLVTKSEERNTAMLEEMAKALESNGVALEKHNASCIRVKGLHGKDNSVSAITIGTASMRGRHPDLVMMDDPVTEEDASEAVRKKAQRVYNELSKLCPNVLIIGQPVHKWDLYESLRPILKKMEVPHGSIPELDHDLEAQRLAGVSEESIQASYFLKVISESASPLEAVKYIDDFPKGDSVAFIDPSFEGGDFTALSIVRAHFDGVAVKGKVYKKAWNHCLEEMAAEMVACGVRKLCFETNALGDQPLIMLRELLPGVGVVGKKSTGHKHSRIMAAGVFAHLIHLAKTSDRIYIEQTVKYEYGAKNDDAPDSLASALEWIGLIRGKTKA